MREMKIVICAIFWLAMSLSASAQIVVGADCIDEYLPLLEGKRVAILANHTSLTSSGEHIVDMLKGRGVDIKYIFAPEHGFRGTADAGESIKSGKDAKTGISVVSLYGSSKRPSDEVMQQIDVALFDLQDVGVRYYTYLSSLHYLMEAAAANGKRVIVLDRPNPNGFYVDGPIRDDNHKSFVAIYPVPVVHGMTLGELAGMAAGEGWFSDSSKADIYVVKCRNYSRLDRYELPVPPSPNLQSMKSIYLYPSICPFEGTPLSLGRGTTFPFLVYGHPDMAKGDFSFTPGSTVGASNPPLKGQLCHGVDLRVLGDDDIIDEGFTLKYVIDAYKRCSLKEPFFIKFFNTLMGVDYVKEMIIKGCSEQEISSMWQDEVVEFKKKRGEYLLYE